MRPMKLTMCGWGSYPEKSVIDFSGFYHDGLFLITGPTGAGKTTIFDAISFSLYGDVSGRTREKTSVRSDFAAPDIDTYIELIFNHKDTEYKIRRSPKYTRPKKRGEGFTTSFERAELSIDHGTPIVSLNEVNKKIDEIMGMNYDQFKKIAMIAQGEFLELLVSSSKDRVEILRNLFKTNQYEKLQYHLSDRAKALFKEIEEYRHRVEEGIHLMDTGDSEGLRELCNAQNMNYEDIMSVGREYVKSDKDTLSSLEKELGNIGEEIREKITSITKGEQINSNIDKLNHIESLLKDKSGEKEQIKEKEEILSKALNAEKVRADERIYQDAYDKKTNLQNKIARMKDAIHVLEPRVKTGEENYKEAVKNESVIEELQNEYNKLEEYLPFTEELIEFKNKLTALEKEIQSIQRKEEAFHALEAEKKDLKGKLEREFHSYEDIEEHIGEIHLLKQIGETKDKTCQEALEGIHQLIARKDQLASLQKDYERVNDDFKDFRDIYQQKEETYKKAIVGIVAKMVKEEEPCPVCGSLEHPHIAKISEEVPEEGELEELSKELEKKKKMTDRIYQETAKKKAEADTMMVQSEKLLIELGVPYESEDLWHTIELLEEKKKGNLCCIEELLEKLKNLTSVKNRKMKLRKEIDTLDTDIVSIAEEKEKNTHMFHEKKSEQDVLKGKMEQLISRLSENFPQVAGNEIKVKEQILIQMDEGKSKILKLKEEISQAKENYELLKVELLGNQTLLGSSEGEYKNLEKETDSKRNRFLQSLKENHFREEAEYKNAVRTGEDTDKLSEEINAFYEQLSSLKKTKAALKEQIQEKSYVDLDDLRKQLEQLEEKEKRFRDEKEVLVLRITTNQKLIKSIEMNLAKKKELETSYGVIKDLDNVTKGFNGERLVFEQYVLASYFEDIIMAANQRLSPMTNGRYELLKVDQVADARTTDSLNLEVFDNYTGKKRSVKTLSGGESFKAALALALGLSDIVQNNAGGIQIDTLFVDEGFGSLDTESLDQALDTLTSLTEHNRLIGIISHVNELKERIDNQIIVEKTNTGSKIRVAAFGDGS